MTVEEYRWKTSPTLTGESFEIWCEDLEANVRPKTAWLYQCGLVLIFERMQTDTQSFYEDYTQAIKSEDERTPRRIINKVKATLKSLYEDYSSSHTLNSLKGFFSFIRANKIPIDEKDLNRFKKSQLKDRVRHIRKASKGAIRDLLTIAHQHGRTRVAQLRAVAILHVLKDSGLSRSCMVLLKVGDVKPAIDKGDQWLQLHQWRHKTGGYQVVHFGPEAMQALREYLHEREQPKEKRVNRKRTIIPGEVLGPDSPLWIYVSDTNIQGVKHHYGEPLTAAGITLIITVLSKKMPIGEKYSAHSMRSFNWTALESGRVPKNWASILQGRSITDSSESYTLRPDNPDDMKKLLGAYQEAYSEIQTTQDTERMLEDTQTEVENLRTELAEIKEYMEVWGGINPQELIAYTRARKLEDAGASTPELERIIKETREEDP